jgi:hypothetical protein
VILLSSVERSNLSASRYQGVESQLLTGDCMPTYSCEIVIVNNSGKSLDLITDTLPFGSWINGGHSPNPIPNGATATLAAESDDVAGLIIPLVYDFQDGSAISITAYVPAGWAPNSTSQAILGSSHYQIKGSISPESNANAVFQIYAVNKEGSSSPMENVVAAK